MFFAPPLACLRHIRLLKPWDLLSVLVQKYDWPMQEAKLFSSFLEPMLAYDPSQRASAWECLQHPWITGAPADFLEGAFFRHPCHRVPPTDISMLLHRPPPGVQQGGMSPGDGELLEADRLPPEVRNMASVAYYANHPHLPSYSASHPRYLPPSTSAYHYRHTTVDSDYDDEDYDDEPEDGEYFEADSSFLNVG